MIWEIHQTFLSPCTLSVNTFGTGERGRHRLRCQQGDAGNFLQLGDICVIGLLDLFDEFRRPVGDVQLLFEFFFQREFIKKRGKDLALEDLGHFRTLMQILP